MDRFEVDGPARLAGDVEVSGAKNAALPCLAATLLTAEPVALTNRPDVADIRAMEKLLRHIGVFVSSSPTEATIEARQIGSAD
ncbi:MAG TPA: UDP-N-acetylglucosamine 1-carboxyvinyltransferase, partial [Thermoanaerobaculia bacterium]|nr:UDP-N-acetylglucosamine 1-carboxyvinyltransferase [Thermoanaerobaculia bacterium]